MEYSLLFCGNCQCYFCNNYDFHSHHKICFPGHTCKRCNMRFKTQHELNHHLNVTKHKIKRDEFKQWVTVSHTAYAELCRYGQVYVRGAPYAGHMQMFRQSKERKINQNPKGKVSVSQAPSPSLQSRKEPLIQDQSSIAFVTPGNSGNSSPKASESVPSNAGVSEGVTETPSQTSVLVGGVSNNNETRSQGNAKQISDSNGNMLHGFNISHIRSGNGYSLYICKLCMMHFIYLQTIKAHLPCCEERNTCIVCFSKFSNRHSLMRHAYKKQHLKNDTVYCVNVNARQLKQLAETNKIADISKCMKEKDGLGESIQSLEEKTSTLQNKEDVKEQKGTDEEESNWDVPNEYIEPIDNTDGIILAEEVTEESPVSPSDSGCQMDDVAMSSDDAPSDEFSDIELKLVGSDLPGDSDQGNAAMKNKKDEGDAREESKKNNYRPLPKSVKVARLKRKHATLSAYLRIQQHDERQVKNIRLQKRTETCPGCMEPIDARSAVLNTANLNVSMWCKQCRWDIVFTDFFHA